MTSEESQNTDEASGDYPVPPGQIDDSASTCIARMGGEEDSPKNTQDNGMKEFLSDLGTVDKTGQWTLQLLRRAPCCT